MTVKWLKKCVPGLIVLLLLGACADDDFSNYPELEWEDLKPEQERVDDESLSLESLELSDDWYTDDFDISGGDIGGIGGIYSGVPKQAFSTGIVSEVDGNSVRVPGFVVPVEFDGEHLVTEFFLVPYFGACYHKPPPPPNQTIYVTSAAPIEYESIYDPVWVMGVINTEQTGNEIATAAYSMDLEKLIPYEE